MNGYRFGDVEPGNTIAIDIPAGNYVISISNEKNPQLSFRINDREERYLRVEAASSGVPLLAPRLVDKATALVEIRDLAFNTTPVLWSPSEQN